MYPNIKKFIEDNREVLCTDLVEFFMISYKQNKLDRSDVSYMSTILIEAGIEGVDEARTEALFRIIDDQVSNWSLADGGVSAMPLYDFIYVFLDNCVGYMENFVLLFMKKNKRRWSKYVSIETDINQDGHAITIISRK